MTAPTFREYLQKGGGNIHYLFHVSGYPWAVATSQALVDALDDAGNQAARRTVFGDEEYFNEVSVYWSEDTSLCPIFPLLEVPGAQKFQLHEGRGRLDGGNWKVEIRDKELGHTWEHGGSTIFRGLPGLHHVLGPDYDSTVGWGYLTSNLEIGEDSFTVQEQSALLKTGIDDASTFPFRLLWIEGECVCADATGTESAPAYTIEIAKDGSGNLGRGLFRSKHQSHYTEQLGDTDPIVSDTPFSIIDKPCWLWAVVLNEDNSDILIDPVILRSGQVSPNIQTRDGKTTIGINGPLKQLDHEIRVPNFAEHLAKYIFTRQEWDGSNLWMQKQPADLYIREFDSDHNPTQHEIYLCPRHGSGMSVRTFNTVEEVMAALNTELNYCTLGDSAQNSGSVNLTYKYSVSEGYIYQEETGETDNFIYYRSWISGPLAWLFNLGEVHHGIDYAVGDLMGYASNAPWFFKRRSFTVPQGTFNVDGYPWMCCEVSDALVDLLYFLESEEDIGMSTALVPRDAWITPFYYSYPFDVDKWENNGNWKPGFVRKHYLPTDTLYFKQGTNLDNINVGDKFILGRDSDWKKRPRILKQEVDSKDTDSDDYPYITIPEGDYLYPDGNLDASSSYYGVGLYYIPAMETDISDKDGDEYTPNMVGPTESLKFATQWNSVLPFENTEDPWILTQTTRGESNVISDPFRAVLGDDGASYTFAPYLTLSNVIGFSDESTEDVDSWIDWDSLDDFSGSVLPGKQMYKIALTGDFNLLSQFFNELVFHGIMPTYEWDSSVGHYMIRFREIGPINITEANNSGRVLTEDTILRNSQMVETHNDTWMFNKLVARCNEKQGDFYGNIVVDYKSGNVANRNAARTLKTESGLSYIQGINNLPDSDIEYITKRYTSLLRHLAVPNIQYSVKTNLAAMVDLAVGRECLVTDSTGYYPFSHEQGLSEAPALVTAMSVDLAKCECKITARLTKNQTKGFAPACYVTESDKQTDGVTIVCTCTANYFSASGDRWDCTYFDCYEYNPSTGVYTAKTCSCGDYKVIAFARNKTGSSWEPTLMNFDVTAVDTTDGNSITLVDQDTGAANYDAWSESDEHIIIFDTYDNCEDCQQKYIFFADDNNKVGTSDELGTRWI